MWLPCRSTNSIKLHKQHQVAIRDTAAQTRAPLQTASSCHSRHSSTDEGDAVGASWVLFAVGEKTLVFRYRLYSRIYRVLYPTAPTPPAVRVAGLLLVLRCAQQTPEPLSMPWSVIDLIEDTLLPTIYFSDLSVVLRSMFFTIIYVLAVFGGILLVPGLIPHHPGGTYYCLIAGSRTEFGHVIVYIRDMCVVSRFFFFHFFSIPFIISALLLSSLLVVTQILGHVAGFSPPLPTTNCQLRFVPCIFIARRFRLFLPSTRVELGCYVANLILSSFFHVCTRMCS